MNIKNRLSKMEGRVKVNNYLPVLLIDNEKSIEDYRGRIGKDTVVIIDDIPEDDDI